MEIAASSRAIANHDFRVHDRANYNKNLRAIRATGQAIDKTLSKRAREILGLDSSLSLFVSQRRVFLLLSRNVRRIYEGNYVLPPFAIRRFFPVSRPKYSPLSSYIHYSYSVSIRCLTDEFARLLLREPGNIRPTRDDISMQGIFSRWCFCVIWRKTVRCTRLPLRITGNRRELRLRLCLLSWMELLILYDGYEIDRTVSTDQMEPKRAGCGKTRARISW